MVAIVGASGSGKSTLLAILGGMDVPSAGRAVVAGYDLGRLSNARAHPLPPPRRRVRLAADRAQPAAVPERGRQRRAADGPRRTEGSPQRRRSSCWTWSAWATARRTARTACRGGEQQRVAIAVALANDPSVVLADEPTGELDSQTSAEVFGLLRRVNTALGTTIIIVTHDAFVSEQVQRTVAIRDGRTSTETLPAHRADRRGRRPRHRRGVRGPRPRGTPPAAAGPRRGAGAPQPGPAAARGRPRRHLARHAETGATGRTRDDGALRPARGPTRAPADAMVVARGLTRDYASGGSVVHALRGIDIDVARGELLAVRGRSG